MPGDPFDEEALDSEAADEEIEAPPHHHPGLTQRVASFSRSPLLTYGLCGLFAAFIATAIVFAAFVIVHLLWFILRAPRVNNEVLCAGIAAYLMMGLFWAFVYTLAARLVPGSFVFAGASGPDRSMAGFEALYFSFGTLTTINYGEIIPVSNVARMRTMAEATISMFYVTVLIARLVSLATTQPAARAASRNATGASTPATMPLAS